MRKPTYDSHLTCVRRTPYLCQLIDRLDESAKIEATRASPSGKALAFQANTRRFESDRPLFPFKSILWSVRMPSGGTDVRSPAFSF